jgi:hypothetical protein
VIVRHTTGLLLQAGRVKLCVSLGPTPLSLSDPGAGLALQREETHVSQPREGLLGSAMFDRHYRAFDLERGPLR